ncbi:hypothetical protein MJO28_004610 [Puccinia striiformis f. sp. tritici]|uniref:Superoxide dismutase copper/zinc binding domain-containing protein n=4 Tax=Eukaryota TaxID=2759 RepID=A0A0L0V7J0_9BASI|nr:hypothetical protein Pst134EA_006789 [Puccinia striiformis f. sp. tritici]ACO90195.1 superoxide dismutase [Triticum aestivum]KAI9608890.1 hypothetical protein H4Q26_005081 [Puccinia striiformis f. sp. tritici PST-130]KNE95280.1 hypothetical protein PSTG_11366 [Puccinia striiformis f. sp. tritici PST-78]POW20374.1 hypothetical protein PSHT_03626 [Puccinia striiformis]KAH9459721.1 hypothetical protein Pst134EB_007951 [Puccinia striiformis f. sp. tritici]
MFSSSLPAKAFCLSILGCSQGRSLHSPAKTASDTIATASFSGSGIDATFRFFSDPSTLVSKVEATIAGLKEGFSNPYHIHSFSLAADGNCTSTGPHFNPMNATVGHCDPANPKLCEVGDLAGKHGSLVSQPGGVFRTSYEDASLKLSQSDEGIFYRSIVIHGPNKVRLACGMIIPSDDYKPRKSSFFGLMSHGSKTFMPYQFMPKFSKFVVD